MKITDCSLEALIEQFLLMNKTQLLTDISCATVVFVHTPYNYCKEQNDIAWSQVAMQRRRRLLQLLLLVCLSVCRCVTWWERLHCWYVAEFCQTHWQERLSTAPLQNFSLPPSECANEYSSCARHQAVPIPETRQPITV